MQAIDPKEMIWAIYIVLNASDEMKNRNNNNR